MKAYRPNIVPGKVRASLALGIFAMLLAAMLVLAVGYTYVPIGKRSGGFFLTGIPTIIFASSLIFFGVASALKLIDHYDKRPNEESYRVGVRLCFRTAFLLLAMAPLVELLLYIFAALGISVPSVHGLAVGHLQPSSSLQQYLPQVRAILDSTKEIIISSALLIGFGMLIEKYIGHIGRRHAMVLVGIGAIGMSSLALASAFQDYLEGKVSAGRRHHYAPIYADSDPERFSAVVLTRLGFGSLLFSMGAVCLVFGATPERKTKMPKQRTI